jgi:hypothetical protein
MNHIIVSDPFWVNNPYILIRPDRIIEFIITKDMEFSEKLNSLVRFFSYLGIILTLYTGTPLYLLIGLVSMVLSIFVYYSDDPVSKQTELIQKNEKYKVPTLNNPLMNTSVLDLSNERKHAIPHAGSSNRCNKVKEDIETKFKFNIYENYNDINNNMQRQFYTMPSEFTANDANGEFKEFLYGGMKSGKENSFVNQIYEPLGRGSSFAV